jgi:hypothetical protein
MRDPSGLKAAEYTLPVWSLSTTISLPVAASQTRAVWSPDAVTMRDPSGLKSRVPIHTVVKENRQRPHAPVWITVI